MPIFFNAESHLWIFGVFIANGLMLTWLLRSKFESFKSITQPFESQLLSAFFISLSLNGLILLALDWMSLDFLLAKWPLLLIALVSVIGVYAIVIRPKAYQAFHFEVSLARLALYGFVFVVLFYNGGLIEMVSDSWWHMSLVNKIGLESTYSPEVGHLIGLPTRYYPPLWHGNLALVNQLSGISIPVFWNSLTAWVGVLKVMAFYLFAYGVSKHKLLALIAAILFILLPGMGVSYLRVSAWPSHVAYTAWYLMFYVFALILDDLPKEKETKKEKTRQEETKEKESLRNTVPLFLFASSTKAVALLVLSIVVFFTHQAEILWFVVAWFGYLMATSMSRLMTNKNDYIAQRDHSFLRYIYRGLLIIFGSYAVWFLANYNYRESGLTDQLLANFLPVLLLLILFLLDLPIKSKGFLWCLVLALLVVIFCAIDYSHLYSLFVTEYSVTKGQFYESSGVTIGHLGGELQVPSWHLQLRDGLLCSGVIAIVMALAMLALKPNRLSFLTAGAGSLAMFFCISPYFYHWLQTVLNYHSPWRISLMIFHPIIIAFVLVSLNDLRAQLWSAKA